MRDYEFLNCETRSREGHEYVFLQGRRTLRVTNRVGGVLDLLNSTYSKVFPKKPPLRIAVEVLPRNGASGRWSVAESVRVGPTFILQMDPSVTADEGVIAHELSHAIARLLGTTGWRSLGGIDERIGDEFSSTCDHPFIFNLLDEFGLGDEQRGWYRTSGENEVTKLVDTADFSALTYSAPPGQTWLGLWYFNLFLLAPAQYQSIYEIHKAKAPGVAEKMDLVRESWFAATKNRGAVSGRVPVQCLRSFQSQLANKLDLHGRLQSTSSEAWSNWLFQGS